MPKSTYDDVEPNKWVPWLKSIDLACCDCHLVHRINWRIKNVNGKQELQLKFRRNGPATGGLRRHLRAEKKAK